MHGGDRIAQVLQAQGVPFGGAAATADGGPEFRKGSISVQGRSDRAAAMGAERPDLKSSRSRVLRHT
jgi:hypothetical protein